MRSTVAHSLVLALAYPLEATVAQIGHRVALVRWLQWRAAAAREVGAVVLAATRVEAGLRSDNLPALAQRLGLRVDISSGSASHRGGATLPEWSRRRIRAVAFVMARWPFGGTCLRRALVAGQRLRALDPVLRIGVRRAEGSLDAHAWLEIGGVSLDPMAADFSPLGVERSSRT